MFTDPVVGLIYRPGSKFVYREEGYADVQVNQENVRDVDWPLDKPADEFRVAVLGDSFVEALQVPIEDRMTEQLAGLLSHDAALAGKKIRVMNFGMSGFGTGQEYLMLRERAAKYKPDVACWPSCRATTLATIAARCASTINARSSRFKTMNWCSMIPSTENAPGKTSSPANWPPRAASCKSPTKPNERWRLTRLGSGIVRIGGSFARAQAE